ncbi:MAG: OmpA family protein [Gammaproteobacteria bacterium]|nr:OmpA family protein [Gammaproteobacteria bacterium]
MKTTNFKRTLLTPIALGVLLASTSVMATEKQTDVEQGWFVQGDIGQAKSYGQRNVYSDLRMSEKRRAWKASTGYRFNNNFALAFNYADLGMVEDFANRGALESIAGKATGLSGIYNFPISQRVNIHAKAGYAHFSGRNNRLSNGGHAWNRTSDNAPFYGAGMSFDLTQNLSLMVDWERYKFDSVTDVVSTGLRYTFGSIAKPVAKPAPAPVYVKPEPVVQPKPAPVPPKPPVIELKPLQVNLYFDNDSSELTHETLEILSQAKSQLVNDRIDTIDVAGFASAVGNSDYNQALSERRATAVVEYIRQNWNIESGKVSVVSHGEDMLQNDSNLNNSRDRRVMVKIKFN